LSRWRRCDDGFGGEGCLARRRRPGLRRRLRLVFGGWGGGDPSKESFRTRLREGFGGEFGEVRGRCGRWLDFRAGRC
jgi:hypothetical protein